MDEVSMDRSAKPPPQCVLLVEDNAILAMSIEEMLKETGASEVLVTGSVAGALQIIERHDIDFAILDFDLGGEDSTAVALRLQATAVPFVIASGYGAEVGLPAELAGSAIMRKPYMMADIEQAFLAR